MCTRPAVANIFSSTLSHHSCHSNIQTFSFQVFNSQYIEYKLHEVSFVILLTDNLITLWASTTTKYIYIEQESSTMEKCSLLFSCCPCVGAVPGICLYKINCLIDEIYYDHAC